ncbi:flagellar assembly lytic transglycosylase [Entomospira culicis]|uniref:Lytic transglycosylase domain-containing protein n=1 Tax=Entomospira culicis TaxID=2719989 RepID=A0A968GEI7_9SPIO|nr:lytic transglycosylase domain-containing protein [Entomospira culicis]NIZ18869.1 lytic transglycosylase domain-containing protein [Entomospira culicis]NIZ69084.1 lytic transglycosylase domain-containing protein [Entomospira culicis]WDI37671.1 lytic transglycosylase domain-containing protein [Entomospira culicis]WDI39299.1 lytic transglycosylase domain-containing protein [Entomospira culicis]
MKQYVYLPLFILSFFSLLNCSASHLENSFTAPRDDHARLKTLTLMRTPHPDASLSTKELQQAGLGSDYYYSYHLLAMNEEKKAFHLLLAGIRSDNPWFEYHALQTMNLAKDAQQRGLIAKQLQKLSKNDQKATAILYTRAQLAYHQQEYEESLQHLQATDPLRLEALTIKEDANTLKILNNMHLKRAFWQNGVEELLLKWPLHPQFSEIVTELVDNTTSESFPLLPIVQAMKTMQDRRTRENFLALDALITTKATHPFLSYPTMVRPYIQLAGYVNQREVAIEQLQSALKHIDPSHPAYFEIQRANAVLHWRLGRYKTSVELFAPIISLATNNQDYNDVVWYYLNSLYRNNPKDFMDAIASQKILIHQEASWFDDLFQIILRDFVANRKFAELEKVHNLIIDRQASNQMRAQYGWVLARAMHHGFIPLNRARMLAYLQEATLDPFSYAAFMAATALNEVPVALHNVHRLSSPLLQEENDLSAILEIDKTSEAFSSFASAAAVSKQPSADLHLLGFIYYGLNQIAIDKSIATRTLVQTDTLRLLARALDEQGEHLQAIRMMNRARSKPLFQPDQGDLRVLYPRAFYEEIHQAAQSIDLKTSIYLGLIRTESGFSPEIQSRASAQGLAQVMPATAKDMARQLRIPENDIDLSDVTQNLLISSNYIYWIQGRLPGLYAQLAGYNGGPNRVRRWREEWKDLPEELFIEAIPYAETRNYVKSIVVASATYEYLYNNETPLLVISHIYPSFKRTNTYASQ